VVVVVVVVDALGSNMVAESIVGMKTQSIRPESALRVPLALTVRGGRTKMMGRAEAVFPTSGSPRTRTRTRRSMRTARNQT
jgi:hypothetical protein